MTDRLIYNALILLDSNLNSQRIEEITRKFLTTVRTLKSDMRLALCTRNQKEREKKKSAIAVNCFGVKNRSKLLNAVKPLLLFDQH